MAVKKLNLDFTNVSEGFKTVAPGKYEAFVFDVTDKVSSSGNTMFEVILKIAEGEYKGSQLWHYLVITEKALFRTRDFLMACGIEVPKSSFNVDMNICIGKKVLVTVTNEEYQGKMKGKVDNIESAGEATISGGGDDEDMPI